MTALPHPDASLRLADPDLVPILNRLLPLPLSKVSRSIALLLVALLVAACGGDAQPSSVSWRNVQVQLPDGWYLLEDETTRLSIANVDLREVDDDGAPVPPDGDVVAMFFTYEPGAVPDDWRRFVADQVDDGVLESDDPITVGEEIPATRLIFSYESNEIPTREMVVVIPSRSIVLLAQPVPGPGDTDAPDVFMEHLDTFLEVLETADFGAPFEDD